MGIDNKPWWCPMIQDYAKYFKCFVINSQDSSIKEILKSSLNGKLGSKRWGNLPQIIEVASCRANIHSFPKVCALWRLPTSSSAQFSSVAQSCLTLCDPMNQHGRPPCPSPTPGVHSDSSPSSQWCHPAISSSGVPFSSCPKSLPASVFFRWVNSSHEVAKVLEFQL